MLWNYFFWENVNWLFLCCLVILALLVKENGQKVVQHQEQNGRLSGRWCLWRYLFIYLLKFLLTYYALFFFFLVVSVFLLLVCLIIYKTILRSNLIFVFSCTKILSPFVLILPLLCNTHYHIFLFNFHSLATN